jgi:hypothetical protein
MRVRKGRKDLIKERMEKLTRKGKTKIPLCATLPGNQDTMSPHVGSKAKAAHLQTPTTSKEARKEEKFMASRTTQARLIHLLHHQKPENQL